VTRSLQNGSVNTSAIDNIVPLTAQPDQLMVLNENGRIDILDTSPTLSAR